MNRFAVDVVQFDSRLETDDDDDPVERMADAVASSEAELIVFPELATTGYHVFDALDDVAEPVPGPTTDVLGAAAADAESHVLFGMPVRSCEVVSNAAVWLE